MRPRTAGPLTEMFPSFYSIAEIKVSEVNNSAEYGGISDITTVSKSGTNSYHGGVFENHQNKLLILLLAEAFCLLLFLLILLPLLQL